LKDAELWVKELWASPTPDTLVPLKQLTVSNNPNIKYMPFDAETVVVEVADLNACALPKGALAVVELMPMTTMQRGWLEEELWK
jgi:hypothetical protein